MKTIEKQLRGLVTRNLGSGNAFGEFDNADGATLDLNCDDSLGNDFTLDGMKTKIAEKVAQHAIKMNERAEAITVLATYQANYDTANNMKKGKDKEAKKAYWLPKVLSQDSKVKRLYAETQAGGDAITNLKLAYNCKLFKAQKQEEKRVADELAKGKVVATDVSISSAKPIATDKLNNPPVPPINASAEDVKKAVVTDKKNTGRNIALIGGGLLLVVGVFLFIRSRRK